jgi:hypothetical protein
MLAGAINAAWDEVVVVVTVPLVFMVVLVACLELQAINKEQAITAAEIICFI